MADVATHEGIITALGDREAALQLSLPDATALRGDLEALLARPMEAPESTLIASQPGQISELGYELIVQFETGGHSYYENFYKSAPVWPGYSSGITIGFGFDLGYNTAASYRAAWINHLSTENFERMLPAIGFFTTEPNREEKVERAKRLIRQYSDIKIPWGTAETVFVAQTLPRQVTILRNALPSASQLPADCFGALLSLVFNRGASFNKPGTRYLEMRNIRDHLQAGALERVPAELRSMKRLWPGETDGSLADRREKEARLWERGVATRGLPLGQGLTRSLIFSALAENAPADSAEATVPLTELAPSTEADWYAEEAAADAVALRSSPFEFTISETVDDARWAADAASPDYRHLDNSHSGSFQFTADHLDLLLRANHFNPDASQEHVLFGLRGCQLQGGQTQSVSQTTLSLEDIRPDHRTFRCVLGVYHRPTRTLSAFIASTVPNRGGMLMHKNANPGTTVSNAKCNLLPTGMHPHVIGTHVGQTHQIPGAFLQGTSAANRLRVVVQRTQNDLIYGTQDIWHDNVPHDNIHPAFSAHSAFFSSVGCSTVRGSFGSQGHTGEWAAFRRAAGLTNDGNHDGKRYSYVLLTGLEALLASRLTAQQADQATLTDRLWRLRHGSTGEPVRKLQAGLGIGNPDGDFGAITKTALVRLQQTRLGFADGIFSPEMEGLLGIQVFA
jgi:hypothetical protein